MPDAPTINATPAVGPDPLDAHWMRRALHLAEQSIGAASPNPVVGCILVQNNHAIAQGAHLYDHRDHAEVVALKQAGDQARNATAYVTLEPCSHFGRTGPCADALIRAGVARVVVATPDPNPLVSGRGIARLREAGIPVDVGILQHQARELNNGFARHIRHHRPFVTLKAGLSLDGRIAPAPLSHAAPTTTYLTSSDSLATVQRMRHASDAILIGIGTVLHDNPLLTDRSGLPRRHPLLRVVLDTTLRLSLDARLVQTAHHDLLVYTANATSPRADLLRQAGVLVETAPASPPAAGSEARLDLPAILALLGDRGILNLLVEGGSHLNRAFLEEDLADTLHLFYAPLFLGDLGVPLLAGKARLPLKVIHSELGASGNDFSFKARLHDPWS